MLPFNRISMLYAQSPRAKLRNGQTLTKISMKKNVHIHTHPYANTVTDEKFLSSETVFSMTAAVETKWRRDLHKLQLMKE